LPCSLGEGKIFYKKGRQSNFRRGRPQERFEKRKEETDLCFHCKKTGHLIVDCPSLQAATSKNVYKKKAMVATWDDSETDFEEEIDAAHVCFMANGEETSMVNLETSLEDDDLTMDELAQVFEELQNRYEISLAQNKKLKKKNDFLKNKLKLFLKRKMTYLFLLRK